MTRHPDLPEIWRERVRSEWCDYNDHLNMAYYILIFDHATDAFYDSVGLDESYRRANACSTFSVESHTTYLAEVRDGDEVFCTTQLLGYDAKRFHYFHRMYHAGEGYLAATTELMGVHVDMTARRVVPMDAGMQAAFGKVFDVHAQIPAPEQQGRIIGIPRR